jgi:YHS domain-containing protein
MVVGERASGMVTVVVAPHFFALLFAGRDRSGTIACHRHVRRVSVLNGKNTRYREVKMPKDPVCNMDVDETTAKYVSEYKGKKYFFCAPGCKAMFDRDPEKFA